MHKNTLFPSSQNNFYQKFSQKIFFLTFFLIIFIFSAFFSINLAFAGSKKTSPNGEINYNLLKTYKAGDTIRISTNTGVSNNAVKIDGFTQDENDEWVSYVFTDTDVLNIITTFEIKGANTGNTVTETITASGETPLRLKLYKNSNVPGTPQGSSFDIFFYNAENSKNLSDSEKNVVFEDFISLSNAPSYNGSTYVMLEAKVEAVCELSGYERIDESDESGSSYVYVGESVEQDGVKYSCLDTGEFKVEQLAQNVDLKAISEDNPKKTTVGEVLDLDFEIGVVDEINAEDLERKNVWFTVEWDADEFLLVDGDEIAIAEADISGLNKGATNWTCTGNLGAITCSANSHSALDRGITTTGILEKFDFIARTTTRGDNRNKITFSTGIGEDEKSVVDNKLGNNRVTLEVEVVEPDLEIVGGELQNSRGDTDVNIADWGVYVKPQIKNLGNNPVGNLVFEVEYNSDYLEYNSSYIPKSTTWEKSLNTANHKITFTQKAGKKIGDNSLENFALTFTPKKYTENEDVSGMIKYKVLRKTVNSDGKYSEKNISGKIGKVEINFNNGEGEENEAFKDENPSSFDLHIGTFDLSEDTNASFRICENPESNSPFTIGGFPITNWSMYLKENRLDFETQDSYQVCIEAYKTAHRSSSKIILGQNYLTVEVNDINEAPTSETGDNGIPTLSVLYNTATTWNMSGLELSNESDLDEGDNLDDLKISKISTSYSGNSSSVSVSTIAGAIPSPKNQALSR